MNAGFNLTVLSNGRAVLSFVTEGGFNCPIGAEIVVACEASNVTTP